MLPCTSLACSWEKHNELHLSWKGLSSGWCLTQLPPSLTHAGKSEWVPQLLIGGRWKDTCMSIETNPCLEWAVPCAWHCFETFCLLLDKFRRQRVTYACICKAKGQVAVSKCRKRWKISYYYFQRITRNFTQFLENYQLETVSQGLPQPLLRCIVSQNLSFCLLVIVLFHWVTSLTQKMILREFLRKFVLI